MVNGSFSWGASGVRERVGGHGGACESKEGVLQLSITAALFLSLYCYPPLNCTSGLKYLPASTWSGTSQLGPAINACLRHPRTAVQASLKILFWAGIRSCLLAEPFMQEWLPFDIRTQNTGCRFNCSATASLPSPCSRHPRPPLCGSSFANR